MTEETNRQDNRTAPNEPRSAEEFAVSPMVAAVPCVARPFSIEHPWIAENLHLPMTVGFGETEDEARADFYQTALMHYMTLAAFPEEALTLTQARELEYFREHSADERARRSGDANGA